MDTVKLTDMLLRDIEWLQDRLEVMALALSYGDSDRALNQLPEARGVLRAIDRDLNKIATERTLAYRDLHSGLPPRLSHVL